MSYIAFEPGIIHYLGYTITGLGALGFVIAVVLILMGKITPVYALGAAMIMAVGLIPLVFSESSKYPTAQDRAVAVVIEEHYGIELTDDELLGLGYPREEPPESFEAFGSFEQMLPDGDGGYELNRIFLIWENGQMKLASSTDGESFAPLKTESN